MKALLEKVAAIAVLVGAVWFGLHVINTPAPIAVQPDTVYLNVSAKSAAVAETVTNTVTRFRILRDSVRITVSDTIEVKHFLTQLDTVFLRCDQCAEQLREHRRVSDSIIKVRNDTIASLRSQLASCKGRRPWWALGGVVAGITACKV